MRLAYLYHKKLIINLALWPRSLSAQLPPYYYPVALVKVQHIDRKVVCTHKLILHNIVEREDARYMNSVINAPDASLWKNEMTTGWSVYTARIPSPRENY